jgi:LmbE family N-acetylglucosaminyl deacetylase
VTESPRLVAVFAHPDDDVYQIGGSVALRAGSLDLTVVVCTSGDAGPIWVPELATRETLAAVRESEELAALAAVGAPDADVRFLRHGDWHLLEVPFDDIVTEIEAVLVEREPHVVVSFGPDGLTSHHDHIRAGEAATEAFRRTRASANDGSSLRRLYHTALSRTDVDHFYASVQQLGVAFGGEEQLFNPVGVPDRRIAARVDIQPVAARKLEGILAHRTQIGEWERIPEQLRWIHLDAECFVQAWPPRSPDEPVLGDLFDGVEIGAGRS